MAKTVLSARIRPSLLDRLIDREPKIRTEPPAHLAQSHRELKESLRRDLEWLLNARRTPNAAPPAATNLARSVYHYGLPDFTNYSLRSTSDRQRLAQVMESTIMNFEPRLTAVSVTLLETGGVTPVMKFQIEALLRVEPAPERVFFDAKLELSTSQYRVEGESVAK